MADPDGHLDFGDTFLHEQHLRSCYDQPSVVVNVMKSSLSHDDDNDARNVPLNYRLRWTTSQGSDDDGVGTTTIIEAVPYPRTTTIGKGNTVHGLHPNKWKRYDRVYRLV